MIKIEVNNGGCHVRVEGITLELLAEVPIGFGQALHGILKNVPADLKQELIKGVFELTLNMMKREAEGNAN